MTVCLTYLNCRAAAFDTAHHHLNIDADSHPTGQIGRSPAIPHDG